MQSLPALAAVFTLLLQLCAASATIDNVAVQWNSYLTDIMCRNSIPFLHANTYYSQLHLAQWHALIALKHIPSEVSSNSTEEAAVAYASRAVLTYYLPYIRDGGFDRILESQLKTLNLTPSQTKFAKQVAEAVALRLVQNRLIGDPGEDYLLGAATDALDADRHPAPGIYRYDSAPDGLPSRFFASLGKTKPYILPNPIAFRKTFLRKFKPPAVPSPEWDREWNDLKDIGRQGFAGRTLENDRTASYWNAGPYPGSLCTQTMFWPLAAIELLPPSTSLAATVELFAKLHVAIHDATVLGSSMQWAYWFWRPMTAFRTGDRDHEPIPDWTSFVPYNAHPEYPSLTTSIAGAGSRVLERWLESHGVKDGPFTVATSGTPAPACDYSGPVVGPRQYASLDAAVKDAQLGRMYAGAHFNGSTRAGAAIGAIVADYVEMNWLQPAGPSGVLPDVGYLRVVAQTPKKAGKASDIEYEV
ncbi:hypothetical protein KC19_9G158800 [Ceratodon purpureus]|uniref:Phosphatidic acid phosphatase type 2/haloperoxidase domain-containing protein n=1 Tax=Ceratodon purpureus TaxID=3225 RepID=A0A8T0GVK1_CERPU|nr:hypothetical protein KC19_9G158800 [Ceratodon purpureus]